MRKYIYFALLLFAIFAGLWGYRLGYDKAKSEIINKNNDIIEQQRQAITNAQQKILDFQRVISYNNDDCFNRVWDEEIIRATNPFLR